MATYRTAGQLVRHFTTSQAVRNKMVTPPIKLYGVEGRYATALYSAASKEKKLDVVEKELNAFQGLLKTDTRLAEFLLDPSYQRQAKQAAMAKVIAGQKYSSLTSNFFAVLSENGRLQRTSHMLAAFNKLMSAHRGEVSCSVTTAKPLDAASQKELRTVLQGFMKKGETLQLEMKVDPEIMGGMIVNIGDKFVDMCTASKIKKYTAVIEEAV